MDTTNHQILEELKAIRKQLSETVTRSQLNSVIALLLISVGKNGQEEIIKNRRATAELVAYLGSGLGLQGKDLGAIFNTSGSGISNLKKKAKKKPKTKKKPIKSK